MDFFENDGIDNRKQILECMRHYDAFFESYTGLSKCFQDYISHEYAIGGKVPLAVAIVHIATALEAFSELLGVEDEEWEGAA